ncbi:MAG: HAMP domain-containing sensor histidine kinase [Ilumatobacteraceae bacterium]
MRRRILVAILSITGVAVLLFGIPLAIMVDRLVEEDATLRIERQAVLAAREVPADFATSADPVELPSGKDGVSLAFYDRNGTLVTGQGPATADDSVRRSLTNQIATAEDSGAIVVAIPVNANEMVIGVIRGQQPTSTSDARTLRIVALVAGLGIVIIGIGAALAFFVAGRLARPVRRLRDAAVQLGNGDFTLEVSHSKVPEIDQAAEALALTARRLDDLVSRERAFSADASHQLRTPLAGLRAGIETELAFPRADSTEILTEALDDIGRLERTISELLTLARTPNLAASTCSLADVQHDVVQTWHGRFATVGRRLTIEDATNTPTVAGSGAVLRHALDVLLDNALLHGAGETRLSHVVGHESITITVTDEGPGLAAAVARSSLRGEAEQTEMNHGLGLPMARRLINSMPGRLTIAHAGHHPRIEIVIGRADTSTESD